MLGLLCMLGLALALWAARVNARLSRAVDVWRGRVEAAGRRLSSLEASGAALSERRDELADRLTAETEEKARLASEVASLTATLEQERRAAREKLALLEDSRARMTAEFRALAADALREHGEDFRKSAGEQLCGIVAPLKDDLGRFGGEMRSAREAAVKEQAALREQLRGLMAQSATVSGEAAALTRALRGDPQRQGAWGEMILSRLLETAGLTEGREYTVQAGRVTEDGRRLRPDVLVTLPGGRQLVIDSKVSLTAYDRAVNSEDDDSRAAALAQHVLSLQTHIKGLAAKGYDTLASGSADYVILFVPIEGALSEALRTRSDLTEFALERQVMIATPTTLMMALRTIRNVWDVERRSRNAEEIAERAGKLFDKIAGFVGDLEKVGRCLDDARREHDRAVAKLSTGQGNVLRQVQMLKDLGAKTSKSLPMDADDGRIAGRG